MGDKIYHGTYAIRALGKGEMGIHMPSKLTGEFAIYELPDGNLILEKVGDKKKVPG